MNKEEALQKIKELEKHIHSLQKIKELEEYVNSLKEELSSEEWSLFDSLDVGTKIIFDEGVEGLIIKGNWVKENCTRNGKAVLLLKHSSGNYWCNIAKSHFHDHVRKNLFKVVK